VLNKQRVAIYNKRRHILKLSENESGVFEKKDSEEHDNVPDENQETSLKQMIMSMVENEIEQVVLFHTSAEDETSWNIKEIYEVASTIFPIESADKLELNNIREQAGNKKADIQARSHIIDYLMSLVEKAYQAFEHKIADNNILRQIETAMLLRAYDTFWMNHLSNISHLRTGVGLVGYGQQDPLVVYKKRAYEEYQKTLHNIQQAVVYNIFKVGVANPQAMKQQEKKQVLSGAQKNMSDQPQVVAKRGEFKGEKVGRNDPCPCGSGKKFKKCCGS